MKLALCTDRSENIEHISQLIVGNDFKYEIQLVICKKDSSASLYCIKNGIENFDYDKENDNKTIDMRTTQKIENGDINYIFYMDTSYEFTNAFIKDVKIPLINVTMHFEEIGHSIISHYVNDYEFNGACICAINLSNSILKSNIHVDMNNKLQDYKNDVVRLTLNYIYRVFKKPNGEKIGKVRNIYPMKNNNMLAIVNSDRQSAFDRHIGNIKYKGFILNELSAYWFKKIKQDLNIKNHYINHNCNVMFVKKCTVIPLEIIVRGYMTGSTRTSLWTHYNNGSRNYCGNVLREGYKKNEKLDNIIVTPTTKGIEDVPISFNEILERELVNRTELEHIYDMAMCLFEYGQQEAHKHGLILVDTKYEFGYHNGEIILIDEVHTCDSSRYWKKDTYQELFNNDKEPHKFDKDIIRDHIKKYVKDPYNDEINVDESIYTVASNEYQKFYTQLTGEDILFQYNYNSFLDCNRLTNEMINEYYSYCVPTCVILSGSESDSKHVNKIRKALDKLHITNISFVCSAHKNTKKLLEIMDELNSRQHPLIFVTCAGKSDALSGVVSCNTQYPVIACPPHADKVDMMVNMNSTLQMPTNVPVMTVLNITNVAICVNRIFNFGK